MNNHQKIFVAILAICLLTWGLLAFSSTPSISGAATRILNSCSDSDGGKILTAQGKVTGYNNNKAYTYSDACATTVTVKEYYCYANLWKMQALRCPSDHFGPNYCSGSALYHDLNHYTCSSGACTPTKTAKLLQTCSFGCTNGACNPSSQDSCHDYDGGIVLGTSGTVSGYYNSAAYSFTDACTDSSTLQEYYCNDVYSASDQISCGTDVYGPNYCRNSSVYQDLDDYYCTNGACSHKKTSQLAQTCAHGCVNASCSSQDSAPPIRTNGAPSATLAAGTTSATLRLATNEAATCRYSTTANAPYSSMTHAFSNTGGTSHSTTVTGLLSHTYRYYIRCRDGSGNANFEDLAIAFSVAANGKVIK